jgi:hypothetical protein
MSLRFRAFLECGAAKDPPDGNKLNLLQTLQNPIIDTGRRLPGWRA